MEAFYIRDVLEWFVSDGAFTRLNVPNFKKYGKSAEKSMKGLRAITTDLSQNQGLIVDNEIRQRLISLVIISDLAFEAFDKDKKKTIEWLMTRNHYFFGSSPFEMALVGKAESVIETLREWLGYK